jgi:trans-aconitate methyltransferase
MMDHSEEIIGLYKRHALAWAKRRSRGIKKPMEAAWLDRFMSRMPSRPAVLDIGCGSGEPMSRYLAEYGCTVTGVDSSSEMIALYERALPLQSWQVADMRSLSLGATFDGLLAWDSFFHLHPEDQRRMFPIFRAHAAPGAVLMFTAGPGYGVAMGTFEGEPLYHASLDADDYSALLDENGFGIVAHVVEDEACGRHTIWLAQMR